MENNIVTAKFKKWNIFSLIPLILGILSAAIIVFAALSEEDEEVLIALIAPVVIIIVAFIIKICFAKLTLTITEDWIYSTRCFKKKSSMPIKKVSYVSTGLFKRLTIHSDGGRLNFWACKNDNEIFSTIIANINKQ